MDIKMTVVTKEEIPRAKPSNSKYEPIYRRLADLKQDTVLRLDFDREEQAHSFSRSLGSAMLKSRRSPVAGRKMRRFLRGTSLYVLRLPDEEPKP